jgi:hypothetical protein
MGTHFPLKEKSRFSGTLRLEKIMISVLLKARRQKVAIKNNSSAYCEISAGVPQISVIGPLLFVFYINDIADKLISLSRLFADDTSLWLFKSGHNAVEKCYCS